MNTNSQVVRVQFGPVEDCRRVVFEILVESGLPESRASRIAGVISSSLRDAGHLGSSLEQHYSASDAAALMGGRCSAWAVKHARSGDFGPVYCDGGDWLIPASGLRSYLERFSVVNVNVNVKVTLKKGVEMGEIGDGKSPKGTGIGRSWRRAGHGPTDAGPGVRDGQPVAVEHVAGQCCAGDVVSWPTEGG